MVVWLSSFEYMGRVQLSTHFAGTLYRGCSKMIRMGCRNDPAC